MSILLRLDFFEIYKVLEHLNQCNHALRLFKYQLGLNNTVLALLLLRVMNAQKHFRTSPLAVISSVFGTQTTEDSEFSEKLYDHKKPLK